jgi:hypothetical protein
LFSHVHSTLLHPDPDVILGQGYAIPPYIQRMGAAAADAQAIYRPRPAKVVKTVSQFDEPGGWKPVQETYNKKDFEDGFSRDNHFLTGPPLGKNKIHFLCVNTYFFKVIFQ